MVRVNETIYTLSLSLLVLHRSTEHFQIFSRLFILPWNVFFGKLLDVVANIILENLYRSYILGIHEFYDTDFHFLVISLTRHIVISKTVEQ